MIKISPTTHCAVCEKCEKPFKDPNAVVVTELNQVNGTLYQNMILCHVQVNNVPGFRSYAWADRLTMWHHDCWPGLHKEEKKPEVVTADTVKEMITNTLNKKDWDSIYRYMKYSLKCSI